jgi:hypothetical protein
VLLKRFHCSLGEVIFAISNDMSLVRRFDGIQHFGMYAGVVIAGEASAW